MADALDRAAPPTRPGPPSGRPTGAGPAERLSKRVYDTILADIMNGVVSPGDRLPTEAAFAERFGVSRPVVREALAQLRDDGLIQARRGSGSYVMRRPSSAMLQFAPLGSIADIQRCFEFRAAVEPAAAALAANRRNQSELDALQSALEALDAAVMSRDLGAEADFAFHRAVAQASGNTFFETTLLSLEEAAASAISVNRNLSLRAPEERLARVQQEHERVFEQIQLRNSDAAESAMREHIEGARRRVFEGE